MRMHTEIVNTLCKQWFNDWWLMVTVMLGQAPAFSTLFIYSFLVTHFSSPPLFPPLWSRIVYISQGSNLYSLNIPLRVNKGFAERTVRPVSSVSIVTSIKNIH